MRATSSSDEQQNNPWQPQHASGRDSVDYHQYLEKIEKFRVNNPKVYNRPLQKNVPTVSNSKMSSREQFHRQQQQQQQQHQQQQQQQQQNAAVVTLQAPPPGQRLSKSQPRENCDPRERAEVLGLVRSDHRSHSMQHHHNHHPNRPRQHHHPSPNNSDSSSSNKNHDMDYQEYMNIINKVRKTKEFTRVRTEQIRLASMYAQEKKRQEEIKLEEQRLRKEREKIEKEREEAERRPSLVAARVGPGGASLTDSNRSSFQGCYSVLLILVVDLRSSSTS